MKSRTPALEKRGSVILIAILTITIITLIAGSILSYSSFSYRSARRKMRLSELNIQANNDMEYLFYRWCNTFAKPSPYATPELLLYHDALISNPATTGIPAPLPSTAAPIVSDTTAAVPNGTFLPALSTLGLSRGLYLVTSAQGQVVDSSSISKIGSVKYWNAKTRVQMTDPILGSMEVRIGRRFTYQSISFANDAVYYQGDMEFGANGQMNIFGTIQSNASVYMGAQKATSSTLTIHDNIYFYTNFNGASDNSGTQYSIRPGASSLLSAPTFTNSQAAQVQKMPLQDNATGFNDPSDPSTWPINIASTYPAAYPNGINDVYRALIAPPPTDASGNLIPEDAPVAATRLYNNAGLRITIGPGNSVFVVDPSTNTDPSGGAIAAAITAVRAPVYDAREQKQVNMTTLDVSQLTSAITTVSANTGWQFNGVLYIYDTNASTVTPSTGQPDLNGIRLINGAKTPNFDYSSTFPSTDTTSAAATTGFTVASNNGVYIQGDYNTATNGATTNPASNRTSIMADAVTALSAGWSDSNSAGSVTPAQPNYRAASGDLTINAAIMTGNTPSQIDASGNYVNDSHGQAIQSGGVQNLVRYLEDWYYTGHSTTLKGSLAQLFTSEYFTSHYYGTGNNVYNPPINRILEFDSALAANPPNGVMTSTVKYYRGDLFTW